MKKQVLLTTGVMGIIGGAIVYLFGGNLAVSIVCCVILFLLLWLINRPQELASVLAESSGSPDGQYLLEEGKKELLSVDDCLSSIKDEQIYAAASAVRDEMDKISNVLKEEPERISSAAHFFSYYLPVFESILARYRKLQENGVEEESRKMVRKACSDIGEAMKRLRESLFEGDMLDLSADIKVMNQSLQSAGLLGNDWHPSRKGPGDE